jgi:Protein of unknown function (DUF3106)
MCKRFCIIFPLAVRILPAVLLLIVLGSPSVGFPQKIWKNGYPPGFSAAPEGAADRPPVYMTKDKSRPGQPLDNLPPEEKARIQRRYREWQSLPPDQKDTMRRRMDEWNRMPPRERDLYQQRHQQWQQLSPDERRQLDNNLRRWDNLSPQERDSIRRRFKK